jgi:hypothetical protein
VLKRNFKIMLKHTDIITAIQNGQNKFLFIGNEACCLEELIKSVIMELNPRQTQEHMNILYVFRDRLGQNTSEFKELIKNRLQRRRGSGNRNCLAILGVNSLNMNLQNWL